MNHDEWVKGRAQAGGIAVTFAAMCLEAFFYDLASGHISKSVANNHVNQPGLPVKLQIIAQKVYGQRREESSDSIKW